MNAVSQKESVASPAAEQNTNKCALKLLGLDFGNLTDEEILEFISEHIQPAAITGLFYDSYYSFYVLHLGDIESTYQLIGKTLQMGTYNVNFLPLLDCFVIGNVYLSLSNTQLRQIFSVFGNVCEIKTCHILPNSSKFFHVLSGTREISFLLPGLDHEVSIPGTVMHTPYTFHVKHLCLRCLARGHSLMNCPDKKEETALSEVAKSNSEKNVVINIMPVHQEMEMTFEVSHDGHADEKPAESVLSNVTTIKTEVSEENKGLAKKKDKKVLGVKKRNVAFYKNRQKLKCLSARSAQGTQQERKQASKENNSSSDKSNPDFEHSSNMPKINSLDLPVSVQSCIMRSTGEIPNNALVELMFLDARCRGSILSFVLKFTSNVRAVLHQLRKLQSDLVQEVEILNTVEYRFRQKIWSIIRVLKKYLQQVENP